MPSAGPSETWALVLVTSEVLFNSFPRHFMFAFDDPDPGLGVNEFEVDGLGLDAIAFEVDLKIIIWILVASFNEQNLR